MAKTVTRFGGLILGALGAVIGLLEGCSSDVSQIPEETGQAQEAASKTPIIIDPGPVDPGPIDPGVLCTYPSCDPSITVSREPSLVVLRSSGHAGLLDTHFDLKDVLGQLLAQAGTVGETTTELLRRLWDPYNDTANAHFTEPFAPHCGSSFNGFPLDCPRTGDGDLANPAFGIDTTNFIPVALFNRFDLAPVDGSNCGEYRIIYWTSGTPNFGTVIFEGQLPNPHPECGLEACRPVVEFWNNLSSAPSEAALGNALHKFYYGGIAGFKPVIELNNYGLNAKKGGVYGASGGQIRVNTISDGPWQLRENHVALGTNKKGALRLFFQPVTDKNNPFGELFNFLSGDPAAPGFQSDFVANQATQLAAGDVNLVAMSIMDVHNTGMSNSQLSIPDDYVQNLPPTAVNPFTTAIAGAVGGSGLTADDIVNRATTQSCAGCHQGSNGVALGAGMSWPSSGTPSFGAFVHVGPAGDISEALDCVFLPHRKSVMEGFLQGCGGPNPLEIFPKGCASYNGGKSTQLPAVADGAIEKKSATGVVTIGGGTGVN